MPAHRETEAERLRFCRLAFELARAEGVPLTKEHDRRVRVADGLEKVELRRRAIEALRAPGSSHEAPAATETAPVHWYQLGQYA